MHGYEHYKRTEDIKRMLAYREPEAFDWRDEWEQLKPSMLYDFDAWWSYTLRNIVQA